MWFQDTFLHLWELDSSELYQTQGHHQLFSKQYLLAATSCHLMVTSSPLVTMPPFQTPTNSFFFFQPILTVEQHPCFLHPYFLQLSTLEKGFPGSSVGKESACNAGDPSSIPGLGRFAREGIDYPLQYSWASLVAQQIMNLPAMRETWVQSLGWEDPLEKGKATHSSIQAWRIPWSI